MVSTSGLIADVAAFFRRNPRTVSQWVAEKKIDHWKIGRNVTFGEPHVIAFALAKQVHRRHLAKADATAEDIRTAWRDHLQIRRASASDPSDQSDLAEHLADLERRVARLEAGPLTTAEDHHQIPKAA